MTELKRLTTEGVPSQFRAWVEAAIVAPINRTLEPLAGLLGRFPLARSNVQRFTQRLTAPTTWTEADALQFTSSLSTPCAGVVVMACRTLDAGGSPSAPVGSLTSPKWEERQTQDGTRRIVRILEQGGLTAGTRYVVDWMAFGD